MSRKVETAEIDLLENGVYVVKDGQVIKTPPPESGYRALTIKWQDGKPTQGKLEHGILI
ncbi:DUF3954 domain-containing protein [Halobacillus sp. H74]|uniref:DUF3954 domain-containing protein n=1 Tax=Halobacillus sp. H74 TaxID=3457436 RepID=UPI003FCE4490